MLPQEIKKRHWKNTLFWALGILCAWSVYYYLWQGYYNFGSIVSALASVSSTLIAVSFLFGTLTFYTDFLDSKLGYRKYFGLTGFWFLVMHLSLLILIDPQKNLFAPLRGSISMDQTLGLVAVLILTFMASISHDAAMIKIGPKLWRNSLRMGYLIYFMLIPRAFMLESHLWYEWLQNMGQALPPPSLIASVVGIFVIAFRLSVFPVRGFRMLFGTHKPKSIVSTGDHPHETLQKTIT